MWERPLRRDNENQSRDAKVPPTLLVHGQSRDPNDLIVGRSPHPNLLPRGEGIPLPEGEGQGEGDRVQSSHVMNSFVWKMAWRDSRSSRRRLLLFSISITLGIAALVGIGSFRHSLARAIDDQARSLIGADLVIESTRAFRPEDEALLHALGDAQAREVRFATMATFPKSNGTRLASVRAIGGGFPFYGPMETTPAAAAREFRDGARAVLEESLLFQ